MESLNQNLTHNQSRVEETPVTASYVHGTTDVTPGTETAIPHGFGETPKGFVIISQKAAGSIYDSDVTPHDADNIYVKCDAASVEFTAMLVRALR